MEVTGDVMSVPGGAPNDRSGVTRYFSRHGDAGQYAEIQGAGSLGGFPVFYTSFAGCSTQTTADGMELSEDSAQHSIGAAVVLGYGTNSMRVTGRDGSHHRLVMTMCAGQVSSFYDFVDTFCGSTPPDY